MTSVPPCTGIGDDDAPGPGQAAIEINAPSGTTQQAVRKAGAKPGAGAWNEAGRLIRLQAQ